VFCSGKFYYDLEQEREKRGRKDVALIRLEQLFPLPILEIEKNLAQFSNAKIGFGHKKNHAIWELGAICYCNGKQRANFDQQQEGYYGAPAAGSAVRFQRRHQQVIDYVFDPNKIIL